MSEINYNPFEPPKADVQDMPERPLPPGGQAPPLWNPGAAVAWSLLFTPTFGAYLHMRNWQALGEPERAASARQWCVVSLAVTFVLMLSALFLPESRLMDLIGRVAGLALLLAWYYSSGKSQRFYVLARYGKTYPRRGWGQPLLAGVGALLAITLVFVMIGVAFGEALL